LLRTALRGVPGWYGRGSLGGAVAGGLVESGGGPALGVGFAGGWLFLTAPCCVTVEDGSLAFLRSRRNSRCPTKQPTATCGVGLFLFVVICCLAGYLALFAAGVRPGAFRERGGPTKTTPTPHVALNFLPGVRGLWRTEFALGFSPVRPTVCRKPPAPLSHLSL